MFKASGTILASPSVPSFSFLLTTTMMMMVLLLLVLLSPLHATASFTATRHVSSVWPSVITQTVSLNNVTDNLTVVDYTLLHTDSRPHSTSRTASRASAACSVTVDPHPLPATLPEDVYRVGVIGPSNPTSHGLSDDRTFMKTVQEACDEARGLLDPSWHVLMHVRQASCDVADSLTAAFLPPFDNYSVLIGPPCSTGANIISMIGRHVVTWVPLLVNLDLDGKGGGQTQDIGQGQSQSGLAISSFGRYDSLVQAVILTLTHFRWTKIATVYSEDQTCSPFQEILASLLGPHLIVSGHLGFQPHNTSSLTEALRVACSVARVIVTCASPDVFADLMTSAEQLEMTTGNYVILHASLSTWPEMEEGNSLPQTSCVLFVGQFMEPLADPPVRKARSVTGSVTSSTVGAEDDKGHFLDYLHDAIMLWAVAQNKSGPGHQPRFANLTMTGRTGTIQLDAQGVRQSRHTLLHFQDGRLLPVADLTNGFRSLNTLLWPGGSLPSDTWETASKETKEGPDKIVGGVLGTLFVVIVILGAAFIFRRWRRDRLAQGRSWQVEDRDVKRRQTHVTLQNGNTQHRRLMRMETRGTLGLGSICSLDRNQLFAPVGNYRGTVVAVRTIQDKYFRLTPELNTDLNILKELHHDNLNTFVGAHLEAANTYLLFAYCSKGSLQDVLENEDITLDWMFKMSFATDLARGMEFLHKSALKSHGNLKSSNCVVDSRWVLQVTDYGAVTSPGDGSSEEMSQHALCNALLWTAPELLRMGARPRKGTQKGDVFSFAIILQEILYRVGPYGHDSSSPEEIVENVKKCDGLPFRPRIPRDHSMPDKALTLMTSCWDEVPEQRPEFRFIRKRIMELNGGKKMSMVDNMLALMETHNSRLEQLVADRTAELAQEKAKTDRLLYQMLPPSVAEQLKCGRAVVPEFYDAVSIFFSDIVGFTTIASSSKPLEIVDLLNDLYTAFDDVIFRHDVYKVETIGDAYMCVSGCPRRNGQRHASEIAEMALDLAATVGGVKVRHRPQESLQLRIGLHTGPCAAGVVGVAMPRYCLFGDTVNMASRMESTGKALHIHVSSEMQAALQELDCGFLTLERGMIMVKGKGIHKTFWLVGREGYSKTLPDTFTRLRQALGEANSRPPSPSNTSLTVGDGMYSALRKTSLAVSHVTVTSDSDDGSAFLPCSPVRSESGVDTQYSCGRDQPNAQPSSPSRPPTLHNDDVIQRSDGTRHVTIASDKGEVKHGDIPRIEIS